MPHSLSLVRNLPIPRIDALGQVRSPVFGAIKIFDSASEGHVLAHQLICHSSRWIDDEVEKEAFVILKVL